MKHIKSYKNIQYKIGDHVYLNELNWNVSLTPNCGKIARVDDPYYYFDVIIDNDIYELMGTEKAIIRKSTPKEKKEYELLKKTMKFNI